jgi:hypothetical protein
MQAESIVTTFITYRPNIDVFTQNFMYLA